VGVGNLQEKIRYEGLCFDVLFSYTFPFFSVKTETSKIDIIWGCHFVKKLSSNCKY